MADRRRAGRAWVVAAVAAAVPGAVVVWAAGVDGGHGAALVLALASLVAVAAWSAGAGAGSGAWPDGPPDTHGAGWHQVALVASALRSADEDPRRAPSLVDDRLRALAAAPRPGRPRPDPVAVRQAMSHRTAAARVDAVLDALAADVTDAPRRAP